MAAHREDHKESGDNNSIILFMTLLLWYCDFDGVVKGHKGCDYDIKGIKGDTEYLFNLKQRAVSSDRYGDLVMDKEDFDALHWAQEKNKNAKVLYVQFFTDYVIYITNDKDWEEIKRDCPTTTRFSDNTYVKKVLMRKDQCADNVKRIDLNTMCLDDKKYIYGKPCRKTEERKSLF